jgi:hypothetical protein
VGVVVRDRRRRGTAALVALAAGAALAGCGGSSPPEPRGSSTAEAAAALPRCTHGEADVALGVFRETRRSEVDHYEQWLGCHVELVVDFGARPTWQVIENPAYLLDEWRGSPRRLVLSVAMLPNEGDDSIQAGAEGAYDEHFATLARNLVAGGQQDAILRIGWEFNLPESRWRTDDPAAFVAYWRRIVAAMRSAPGQQFEFTWNPSYGAEDAVPFYPGDDVVDHVGVDVYDATGQPGTYPYPAHCEAACRTARQDAAWEWLLEGERGLKFWAAFAAEHAKPLAIPEWGLWARPDGFSGGHDVPFVERMHAFISDPANNVAYHAYFEFDGADGEHRLMTSFADAGDVFRRLFAATVNP